MDLLTSLVREGLVFCYAIIPNWGFAIILLTIITRIGGLVESIAIFKKLNAENLIQAECDSARGARMPFFGVTSRS